MEWLIFREPVSAWTHGVWFLLSLPATLLLWRAGRAEAARRLAFLVYDLTLACCFLGSTLYHAVRLPDAQIEPFHRMDMIGIYLLIAGSVTPAAVIVLQGRWQQYTLWAAWLVALAGSGLRLTSLKMPPALSASLYLSMGWGVALCYFALARTLSHRALRLVVVGGLFYSVGAVVFMLDWPALAPGVFGPHDLFHVLVMAGSFAHFWFLLRVVAPYQQPSPVAEALAGNASAPAPLPALLPLLLTDPPLPQSGR